MNSPLYSATKEYWKIGSLFFLSIALVLPVYSHDYDSHCFAEWAGYIKNNGLGNTYNGKTDYPPIMQYFLYFFSLFYDSEAEITAHIHFLKLYSLAFHVLTGHLLLKLLLREGIEPQRALFLTMFYLLNIAVIFNNVVWNQVDIILACGTFASVTLALRSKPVAAWCILLITLNFKLQGLIYIPIVALLTAPYFLSAFSPRRILVALFWLVVVQTAILIPFMIAGTTHRVAEVAIQSFGKYTRVSIYAYNAWYFLLSGDVLRTDDTIVMHGLSLNKWGLLLFFLASFAALWPLMRSCWARLRKNDAHKLSASQLMLICGLVPLLFFYFNTQMHERYSHPALVFLISYAALSGHFLPALLACVAYFLNLEDELVYFGFNNHDILFLDERFISGLYLAAIVLCYYHLYFPSKKLRAVVTA